MEKKRLFITVVAGVGMLATFLPWVSLPVASISGTQDGGWLTLILFAAGGAIAWFYGSREEPLDKQKLLGVWIPAALATIIVLLKLFRDYSDELFGSASRGFGLWLALLAGIAQVAVCFFFKGSAGWDIPSSFDDVKKASGLPSAAPAEPAAPAAPPTPAKIVTVEEVVEDVTEEPKEGE